MLKRVRFAIAIPLMFAALSIAAAQSQPHQPSPTPGASSQSSMADMMNMQQMMADMKSGDAKLDELVSTMNAATGEAKVAAIAQTVSELVHQQKTMHEQMGMMHQHMMQMMSGPGMMKK